MENCKPFVKWVGGKRQLLPVIHSFLPKKIHHYYELFLGGGALFFSIQDRIEGRAVLNDYNRDLMECYRFIQEYPEEMVKRLELHQANHSEDYFYDIRDRFNELRFPEDFIYLNKTCYNGLYRVNKKGKFNSPVGSYTNPLICDKENIFACSRALQKVKFLLDGSYKFVQLDLDEGEKFFYLDPPYYPVSKTSNFTAYTADGFTAADQLRLKIFCDSLSAKGSKFMQSNSAVPEIFELYKDYRIEVVSASRNINSKSSKRGTVEEVLIMNY